MTTIEDRPTIGERYSSATESSNLKVEADKRGDVDLMIASGWIKDGLGALLYRLRVEFDACDLRTIRPLPPEPAPDRITRLAEEVKGESEGQAADRARQYREQLAKWHAAESARIAKEYEARVKVAKALALVHMKSLPAARAELGRYACIMATKQRFMHSDAVVMEIVGRVLDVFLDPICRPCHGLGFTGGGRHEQSGPQVICRACKGTKHRKENLGRQDDEKAFAAALLADMESRMSGVESAMRRWLVGR